LKLPLRVAAIVPCHNEEAAVGKVVRDLRASLPSATIYVYDNNSTDRTVERALAAGAVIRQEHRKGKGNVVRRAFADIDADIYLLIDGDDTYDAAAAPLLVQALLEGPYDHVLGVRDVIEGATSAYRANHAWGNRILNRIVALIFGSNEQDMLSGYRVFSRRFVKSFPAVSREFEIETELTVHSLALRVPSTAMKIGFRDRAEGSASKLRTYRDGAKILSLILSLVRHERPILFYGCFGLFAALMSCLLSGPVLLDYMRTGLVPRVPTLVLAIALTIVGALAITAGLVLDGIRKGRHEFSRLKYLDHAALTSSLMVPVQRVGTSLPLGRQVDSDFTLTGTVAGDPWVG
jgi:hypothetical protein